MFSILDGIITIYTELKKKWRHNHSKLYCKGKKCAFFPRRWILYAKDVLCQGQIPKHEDFFFLNICFTVCVHLNVKYSSLKVEFILVFSGRFFFCLCSLVNTISLSLSFFFFSQKKKDLQEFMLWTMSTKHCRSYRKIM